MRPPAARSPAPRGGLTGPNTLAGKDRLIVLARAGELGQVKTRLIPALGADGAARLHGAMVARTLSVARHFRALSGISVEVRVSEGPRCTALTDVAPEFTLKRQLGRDLGERLASALAEAFREGALRVLAIGTDCPELDGPLLVEAQQALAQADLVLGPARDGGYYLIGMRTSHPALFEGIAWGTDAVLPQTLAQARRAGLSVHRLRPLADIDHPEDLVVWRRVAGPLPGQGATERPGLLSIVLPVLNEEAGLAKVLRPLADADDLELLVVDGGSVDRTVDIAQGFGARVLVTRPGRARQMNAGAALASGDVLLFLHADTHLPEGFSQTVRATLADGCVAGAFRLRIDGEHPGLRWVAWGANLRSRLLALPYGDQALFLPARRFYDMGGFADLPWMEDLEFVRRLRRTGRIAIAPTAVTTSARRWQSWGILRTTLIHQACLAGYLLGIPPRWLHRWRGGDGRPDR
jgi:rSAM/selenodomain-associated transferase 2/rSAM/selenodomain-associated transferase 1